MSEEKDLHTVQIAQGKFNFRERERERGNMLQPDGGLRARHHQKSIRKTKGKKRKARKRKSSITDAPLAPETWRGMSVRGESGRREEIV